MPDFPKFKSAGRLGDNDEAFRAMKSLALS
jgi:hypothetical protein